MGVWAFGQSITYGMFGGFLAIINLYGMFGGFLAIINSYGMLVGF